MISKLSNSSLLSKTYYKNMLVGNAPYSQANATISTSSIHGLWTFNTSKNANNGGYTSIDYGSVTSLDSTIKVWPSYSNSLKLTQADVDSAGMVLSQDGTWVINSPSTIEFWFYNKELVGTGYLGQRVLQWGNRQDNIATLFSVNDDGSSQMRTNSTDATTGAVGTIPLNTWSWIVISRSGNELKVFINGVLSYSNGNGAAGNGYTSDGSWFVLGADYDSGYVNAPRWSRPGNWQDLAVYNAAPFHNLNNFGVPTVPITNRIV